MALIISCPHCGKSFIDFHEKMEHLQNCPVYKEKKLDKKIKEEVERQLDKNER